MAKRELTDIGPNELMTLKEACELVFRGNLSPSSLRTEAAKGRLVLTQIARKDFVTRQALNDMIEACKVPASRAPVVKKPVDQGITAQEVVRHMLAERKTARKALATAGTPNRPRAAASCCLSRARIPA